VLARLPARPAPSLDAALAVDTEARAIAREWLKLPVAA
jgi:hypothetical protein